MVRDVVQELISLLPKDNFDLLFDRLSLTPGDELTKAIDGWIWSCDAAVVIVDRAALSISDNPWVFSEASRLQDRRESVEVIPLFVDPVDAEAIKNKQWEAAGLDTPLGIAQKGRSPRDLAKDVAEALERKTLARVRTSAAGRRLAEILRGFSRDVLSDAARPLKDPLRDWSEQRLQHEIAHALLGEADYDVLVEVSGKLAETDMDRAAEVLHVALPYTWVDAGAAAAFAEAVRNHRPVGLNSIEHMTSKAYAARCADEWPPWPVYQVDLASDSEHVHLANDLDAAIVQIRQRQRRRITLLSVVCPTHMDSKYVGLVRERAAGQAELVFLVGDQDPETLSPPLPEGFSYVRPTIDTAVETEAVIRGSQGRAVLWEKHNDDREGRGLDRLDIP